MRSTRTKGRCSGFDLNRSIANEQLALLARTDLIEQSCQPMPSLCELAPGSRRFAVQVGGAQRHGCAGGGVSGMKRTRPVGNPQSTINVGLGQLMRLPHDFL